MKFENVCKVEVWCWNVENNNDGIIIIEKHRGIFQRSRYITHMSKIITPKLNINFADKFYKSEDSNSAHLEKHPLELIDVQI